MDATSKADLLGLVLDTNARTGTSNLTHRIRPSCTSPQRDAESHIRWNTDSTMASSSTHLRAAQNSFNSNGIRREATNASIETVEDPPLQTPQDDRTHVFPAPKTINRPKQSVPMPQSHATMPDIGLNHGPSNPWWSNLTRFFSSSLVHDNFVIDQDYERDQGTSQEKDQKINYPDLPERFSPLRRIPGAFLEGDILPHAFQGLQDQHMSPPPVITAPEEDYDDRDLDNMEELLPPSGIRHKLEVDALSEKRFLTPRTEPQNMEDDDNSVNVRPNPRRSVITYPTPPIPALIPSPQPKRILLAPPQPQPSTESIVNRTPTPMFFTHPDEMTQTAVSEELNHIWDKYPIYTLFEFARHIMDRDYMLPPNLTEDDFAQLTTLSNVEGIKLIAEMMGVPPPNRAELAVAHELDWEAEEIVADSGALLGGDEAPGTRYGGKIQLSAVFYLQGEENGKTGGFKKEDARIRLNPPMEKGSKVWTRTFGSHSFIFARMSKQILAYARENPQQHRELEEIVSKPIEVLGRIYDPICDKDNVIVYFLRGADKVGGFAEQKGGKATGEYGVGKLIPTVKDLCDWWLPLEANRDQHIAKLATRFHLGLSDTLPGIFIHPDNIVVKPDIKRNGYMFTDGAGIISPSAIRACHRKYSADSETPTAYQIRIGSAKGVVQIDGAKVQRGDWDGPYTVELRSSMCKVRYEDFDGPGEPGLMKMHRKRSKADFHILDKAFFIVALVQPAPAIYPAKLSAQFLTILSDGGVSDETLLQLQSFALRSDELGDMQDVERWWDNGYRNRAGRDGRARLARMLSVQNSFALEVKKRSLGNAARALGFGRGYKNGDDEIITMEDSGFVDESFETNELSPSQNTTVGLRSLGLNRQEQSADLWAEDPVSGYPTLPTASIYRACLYGFDLARSAHWVQCWTTILKMKMRETVKQLHLPVPRSAMVFLQPDFSGKLKEGEVCFIPRSGTLDPGTGFPVNEVVGEVIVGRHPAHLPTDMRKARAVAPPKELRYLKNLLIFSTQGERPLADILSGGDYDGDLGIIIWEQSVVNEFQDADIRHSIPTKEFDEDFELHRIPADAVLAQVSHLHGEQHRKALCKVFLETVGQEDMFKPYSMYFKKSVIKHGLQHHTTIRLAHAFNRLMDSRKTGYRIIPHVYDQDRYIWERETIPGWYERTKDANNSPGKPLGGTFILNRLLDEGEKAIEEQVSDFRDKINDFTTPANNTKYGSEEQDQDLAAVWLDAERRSRLGENKRLQECLEKIKQHINSNFNEYMQVVVEAVRGKLTQGQQRARTREITVKFAKLPAKEDIPELSAGGFLGDAIASDYILRLKASYAYIHDMETARVKRGYLYGYPTGYPWRVAMRALGEIKAKAMGGTMLPTDAFETMEVHRAFGQ